MWKLAGRGPHSASHQHALAHPVGNRQHIESAIRQIKADFREQLTGPDAQAEAAQ